MALNSVKKFVKPKSSKDGGTVIIKKSGGGGAAFDSTNLNVVNINANNGNIDNIKSKNIYSDNVFSTLVEADDIKSFNMNTNTITSDVGNINKVNASDVVTNKLTVNDEANIQKIINRYLQSDNIVCDDLTVNKTAHFFELVVDKMRSIEGTQINTAANCVVDYVEWLNSYGSVTTDINSVDHFRLYWRKADQEGREISNKWKVYDQAFCQSFNADGSTAETSNRYYWRLVKQVDNGSLRYINFDKGEVKSIQPSTFQIKFDDFFWYGPLTTSDPSYQPYTSFQVELEDNKGTWNSSTYTWEPESTSYGLRLIPEQLGLYGNTFHFVTHDDTKLTVGVYYVDGSYEFFKWTDANGKQIYKDSYDVTTKELTSIQYIMIYTSVFDLWEECHWIDVSNVVGEYDTEANFNSTPTVGDNVAQLGYQYTRLPAATQDDINRASAIIIAAYQTPDAGITPPSYAQYQNIKDFVLGNNERGTYFDALGAHVVGDFTVVAGGTRTPLDQYIKSLQDSNPVLLKVGDTSNAQQNIMVETDLIALQLNSSGKITSRNNFPAELTGIAFVNGVGDIANVTSLNVELFGRTFDLLNFTSDSGDGIYITNVYPNLSSFGVPGFMVQFGFRGIGQTITNSSLVFSGIWHDPNTNVDYPFSKNISIIGIAGTKGDDAELFMLDPVMEKAEVNDSGTFNADIRYKIAHVVGTTVTYPAPTSTQSLVIKAWNNELPNPVAFATFTRDDSEWDTTNNWWRLPYTYNWITAQTSQKAVYLTAELIDNGSVLDTNIINVNVQPVGFFQVTNELTQSIHANSTAIGQETLNRQSAIQQTADNITLWVQTDYLSNTDAATNYSTKGELNVKANQITAQLTDSLGTTGIDITHGKITLNAANTEITGNLKLRAGLFYSATCIVPSSVCADLTTQTKTLTIDPSITTITTNYLPASNTYLFKNIFPLPGTADLLTNTLILPSATTYEGLEINIMLVFSDDDPDMAQKVNTYGNKLALYIKPQSGENIWAPGNGINDQWYTVDNNNFMKSVRSVTNGMKILRTYPRTSTIISGQYGSGLLAQPNYYFRLKAMGGMWYVIDGLMQF